MTVKRTKKEQCMTAVKVAALGLLLSGCQSVEDGVAMDGVVFINQSDSGLNEVKLKVLEGEKFVSCEQIEVKTDCGTHFPTQSYQGQVMHLSYIRQGKVYDHRFNIETPGSENGPYELILRIRENGIDVSVIKE